MQSYTWVDFKDELFTIDTKVDCGPSKVEFYNSDDLSDLDTQIFEVAGSEFKILESQDVAKKGTYPLKYKVSLERYP